MTQKPMSHRGNATTLSEYKELDVPLSVLLLNKSRIKTIILTIIIVT
jgi:hypothetical protein